MPSDTRKDPRQKTSEVVVRYGSATLDEFVENHAEDVSEGGIFVRTTRPLPPGTLVSFEIRLSNEQSVLGGVGRVAWKRDAAEGHRPAGMGVKFIDVDDASQSIVDRLLAAHKGPSSQFDPPPTAEAPPLAPTPAVPVAEVAPTPAVPAAAPAPSPAAPAVAHQNVRARTVMGLGSPFADAAAAIRTVPRAGTQLGMPSPLSPAGLVLSEQSSPTVNAPPPRAPSTSEIDQDWLTDKAPEAIPSVIVSEGRPAETSKPTPEPALYKPPGERSPTDGRASVPPPEQKSAAARLSSMRPPSPSAASRLEAGAVTARGARAEKRGGSVWPWLLLIVIVAAGGTYVFRGQLRRSGVPLPLLPTEAAPAAPAPPPVPEPTAPPAPTVTVPPPPPAPIASAAAPTATVSAAASVSPPPSAPPKPPKAATPRPKPKPAPAPKPKDDDNPF